MDIKTGPLTDLSEKLSIKKSLVETGQIFRISDEYNFASKGIRTKRIKPYGHISAHIVTQIYLSIYFLNIKLLEKTNIGC